MSSKDNKIIKNALTELRDNNIIYEEQYIKSLEYFDNKKITKSITTLFGAIGIFLIALSIITIFAINWNGISKEFKILISFIPLVITSVMLYITMTKNKKNMKLYTSIFAPVAIIATNSLISQVFHMQTEIYEIIFLSLVMYLPIAFILRNYLAILVYGVGTIIFGYASASNDTLVELIKAIVLTLPLIIYNIKLYLKNKEDARNSLMWTINVALVTMLLFSQELIHANLLLLYLYMIYFITKILFENSKLNKLLTLFFTGCLLVSCIASGILFNSGFILGLDSILIILLTIVGIYYSKAYEDIKEYFILLFIIVTQVLGLPDVICFVLTNMIAVLLGIYKIFIGNQNGIYKEIKQGIAIILLVIFFRFLNSDLDFTVKSIIFLIAGGCFMIGGSKLKKRLGGDDDE